MQLPISAGEYSGVLWVHEPGANGGASARTARVFDSTALRFSGAGYIGCDRHDPVFHTVFGFFDQGSGADGEWQA